MAAGKRSHAPGPPKKKEREDQRSGEPMDKFRHSLAFWRAVMPEFAHRTCHRADRREDQRSGWPMDKSRPGICPQDYPHHGTKVREPPPEGRGAEDLGRGLQVGLSRSAAPASSGSETATAGAEEGRRLRSGLMSPDGAGAATGLAARRAASRGGSLRTELGRATAGRNRDLTAANWRAGRTLDVIEPEMAAAGRRAALAGLGSGEGLGLILRILTIGGDGSATRFR